LASRLNPPMSFWNNDLRGYVADAVMFAGFRQFRLNGWLGLAAFAAVSIWRYVGI
jgi:hypothetical protein